MECPKCHSIINDESTVCPKCHKVLLLECPNCHEIGDSAVCEKCGYTILVKCSKCSKINPSTNEVCSKCGFPVATSLAYQECESDEFASVVIKFNNLKSIRRLLKSKDLYEKFLYKLKNLLLVYIKKAEGKVITYKNEIYAINFNKELSFGTSCLKAIKFALKIANAFTDLNLNILEEFKLPLGLNIEITKKSAENLQKLSQIESNVKLLNSQKDIKKYLKGTQITLDQYVRDEISKEYKTDSLYTMEENGKTVMFYELLIDSYILPPDKNKSSEAAGVNPQTIKKQNENQNFKIKKSFKVFDINAKCHFERTNAVEINNILKSVDFDKTKIISLRSDIKYGADLNEIEEVCKNKGYNVIRTVCTESLNYKAWGILENLFRSYFSLSDAAKFNNYESIDKNILQVFKPLFDLTNSFSVQASSPEDARFAYMDKWRRFFSVLKNTVVIIDGFENIDDTSIQTLEVYFDKFKRIIPNFIFVTDDKTAVHNKIKGLLRTSCYTEYKLEALPIDNCISTLKSDAGNFIESFYFEKIQDNFNGSYLYFKNAVEYLKEADVLIDFENKLLIKDAKSIVLPSDLNKLCKVRMKNFDKIQNLGLVFGYMYMFGGKVDFDILNALGIENLKNINEVLLASDIVVKKGNHIVFNNFKIFEKVISDSLKPEAEKFLASNILKALGNDIQTFVKALLYGKIGDFEQEYNLLLKNSEFSMAAGDYDAYLKNCLGFLSLEDKLSENISKDDLETSKKEVYNNILMCLYSYAPAKIYFIENILLLDAIQQNDSEKIVRLSNLMLQGALISSNYSDAQGLLFNILSRMENASLIVDGAINTKFLLLSLVQIEIFYYTGEFRQCVDTAEEILTVIRPSIIDKIKPRSFSTESFLSHLSETFRLVSVAKLFLADEDMESFFESVEKSLGETHPEKDSIIAVRDYLAGRIYSIGNIEEYSAFSKLIFLILQEIAGVKNNYKSFAQNIFQAKLLAEDIQQYEIKLLCDLLIGYAYMKEQDTAKADIIFNDVIKISNNAGMFGMNIIAKYFLALLDIYTENTETAMLNINNIFARLRDKDNQASLLFVLFETLYIQTAKQFQLTSVDTETETKKLLPYLNNLKRIIGEYVSSQTEQEIL